MAKANYTLDKSSPDFKKLQNPILDGPRARREAGQTESGVCEGRLGGAGHEEASENSFMYFYVQRLGIEGETPLFEAVIIGRLETLIHHKGVKHLAIMCTSRPLGSTRK